MPTTVINIHSLSPAKQDLVRAGKLPNHVYIGRSNANKGLGEWGNRYTHLSSVFDNVVKVRTREEAIDKYAVEKWGEPGFKEKCKRELKGKVLVCYCKPAACHGDLLAKWADAGEVEEVEEKEVETRREKKMPIKTKKQTTVDVPVESAETTERMPESVNSSNPLVVAAKTYVANKAQLVVAEINALTVVNADDYADADILLVRIRQARKLVADKIDPIIKPIRAGLDSLYALRRELDEPLEKGETTVKKKMGEWQNQERLKREQTERAAREKEFRIAREAEEARRQAERAATEARTKTQRAEAERLRKEAEERDAERMRAEEARRDAEAQKAMKGVGSKVTTITRPEVTDLSAFLKAVVEGKIPEICVEVNQSVLAEYWAADAGLVSAWPGVEIKKETRVGGR